MERDHAVTATIDRLFQVMFNSGAGLAHECAEGRKRDPRRYSPAGIRPAKSGLATQHR